MDTGCEFEEGSLGFYQFVMAGKKGSGKTKKRKKEPNSGLVCIPQNRHIAEGYKIGKTESTRWCLRTKGGGGGMARGATFKS